VHAVRGGRRGDLRGVGRRQGRHVDALHQLLPAEHVSGGRASVVLRNSAHLGLVFLLATSARQCSHTRARGSVGVQQVAVGCASLFCPGAHSCPSPCC